MVKKLKTLRKKDKLLRGRTIGVLKLIGLSPRE